MEKELKGKDIELYILEHFGEEAHRKYVDKLNARALKRQLKDPMQRNLV